MAVEPELLRWLHDSDLLAFDVLVEDGSRHLSVLIRGDEETGFVDW